MDRQVVNRHQANLKQLGLRSDLSQAQGPNTIGNALQRLGLKGFGLSTADKTRKILAEIVQAVNEPAGWIPANFKEGKVDRSYLNFYNSTPSSQYAVVRDSLTAGGELVARSLKHIPNPHLAHDFRAAFEHGAQELDQLGVHTQSESGQIYAYSVSELKHVDIRKGWS